MAVTLPVSHLSAISEAGHDARTDVEIALLDRRGVIVAVNQPWVDFCRANGGEPATCGVGSSYLDACAAGGAPAAAVEAGVLVRAALAGDLPGPATLLIPCDTSGTRRWFDLLVSSRVDESGRLVGATVSLSRRPVTTRPPTRPPALVFPNRRVHAMQEVLARLTIGAQAMHTDRDRQHDLLRANAAVAGGLGLSQVLELVVVAARELVDARYAGLGVVGANGKVTEFVQDGMDAATASAIGDSPCGLGILRLLIEEAVPLRLRDLNLHPSAFGLPLDHPPMRSFLGVPILVAGKVYATLHMTESARGSFSPEDEALVVALAEAAGMAIANARAFEDSERHNRWQAAAMKVIEGSGKAPDDESVDSVARWALAASGGDVALVAVVDAAGRIRAEAVAGEDAAELLLSRGSASLSQIGSVLRDGQPLLVERYETREESPAAHVRRRIGSLTAVPLMDGETVRAALVVVRLVGRRPLDAADLGQLADFVRHLSLASTREGLDLNPSDGGRATATAVMATEIQDRVVRPMLELREILSSMVGSGDVIPAAWWPVQVAFLDKTIEDARAVMLEVSG